MAQDFSPFSMSLAETKGFCEWRSRDDMDCFVERDHVQLVTWFVPTAHGVAIASLTLMQRLGYHAAHFQPRGWIKRRAQRGFAKRLMNHRYLVRECGRFFTVERSLGSRPWPGGVLTFETGSVPVVARTVEEAMFLSQLKELPSDLRWVELSPSTDMNEMYDRAAKLSLEQLH